MGDHDPEIHDCLDSKGDRNSNMSARVAYIFVVVLFLAVAGALPSFAVEIIHVPSDVTTLGSAIAQISDGGIIEMAAGTYTSPGGGWFVGNLQKSFTIRADNQATVTLTGAGSKPVLRIQNTDPSLGGQINFEGLIFTDGRSTENGVGGGVTLEANDAVFTDCVFDSNDSDASTTGGGGAMIFDESEVQFIGCTFIDNRATNEGGGLKIGSESRVVVHDCEFTNNRVNLAGHRPSSAGGGIHVGNAFLMVTNTRFDGNEAGYVGGGLYAIGTWQAPVTTPRSIIDVANCTFEDNTADPFSGITPPGKTEGGAFHAEDQVLARVDYGRFLTNTAENGGGVNLYRAEVQLSNTVFRGNQATALGANTGFGGAIAAISNDTTADGTNNRPSAKLIVRDTLIQGDYQAVDNSAQIAGGLFASGDQNRQYGQGGVSAAPNLSFNRADLTLERIVLTDCTVTQTVTGTGRAGGINLGLAALDMDDSLVLASEAVGTNGQGGGIRVIGESLADIDGSTFAGNSAQRFGGAVYAQGAEFQFDNGALIENTNGDANYGAAVFGAPDTAKSVSVTGHVNGSTISNTADRGLLIFDDDRDGTPTTPYNDLRYNTNTIFDQTQGADVYKDSLAGAEKNTSELNSLVVNRSGGTPSTVKSQANNTGPSSAPKVAVILPVPTRVLDRGAAGDPAGPTEAFVGYAWTGGSATLNGGSVSGFTGLSDATVGGYVLNVGGTQDSATVLAGEDPAATLTAAPASISSGQQSQLQWTTTGGTFIDVVLDNSVSIPTAASGTVMVAPTVTTTYHLFVLTEEGGAAAEVTVFVDEQAGLIFADDFESGTTGSWDLTTP